MALSLLIPSFFFLMVQIGQLVHLWYFLIDGGEGGIMKDPYIDTARGQKKKRHNITEAYWVYRRWFHISQFWQSKQKHTQRD